MANTIVVIGDRDGGKVAELDEAGRVPVYVASGDVKTFERGTAVLHRYGAAGEDYYLNVDDAAVPAIGSGIDLSRYGSAVLACATSGDSTWDVVPLYGDSVLPSYTSGDKIDIEGNMSKTVTVAGNTDFYVLCRNKSGEGAGIKVWVAGYNA